MTRFLTVLVLSAVGVALSAGDAAAFGGRKKKADCCPPPCAPVCAPACPAPCPPPVVHCPPPCPAPVPAPVCCPPPAPVCCDPCAKPARVGLLKRLFSRGGGGCGC